MKIKISYVWVISLAALAVGIFHSHPAAAATKAGVYASDGTLKTSLPNIQPGSSLAVADLTYDGQPDIIIGSPAGARASVRILNADGKFQRQYVFSNVKGGAAVHVAAGDVNGDGLNELIVSFGPKTTPEVWIIDSLGHRTTFFAYDAGFRFGVNISVADVDGDGIAEIVTAPETGGGPDVHVYDGTGHQRTHFFAYPSTTRTGVQVLAADVNGDGVAEIVCSSPRGGIVKEFNSNGEVIGSFTPSQATVASLHAASVDQAEIILATGGGSPGEIRGYTVDGVAGSIHFYPFGKQYTGSVTVATFPSATSGPDIVAAPGAATETTGVGSGKVIVVDVSEQRMYRYENGVLIAMHAVSTGKWSMPTPIGTFNIRNKLSTAYSRPYHLYMDNWMAFTADGKYGIHSLPYWRLKNGSMYYEGVAHLGRRVSHGCIRLSPAESAVVYKWATVGTTVTVRN